MMTREEMTSLVDGLPRWPVTRPFNVECLWRAVALANGLGEFPEVLDCDGCDLGRAGHFRSELSWMGRRGLA